MQPPHRHIILYIDDNTLLLACLGDYLRFHGFEVHTATNGREAFKIIKRQEPDLIVIDPVMPGKGGVRFLKDLTSRTGHLRFPVLIYTSRGELEAFYANTGVDGFLSKTAPEQELIRIARDILSKKGRHLTFENDEPVVKPPPSPREPPTDDADSVEPDGADPDGDTAKDAEGAVLLVENDPHVAQPIEHALRQAGLTVTLVTSPQELLARVEAAAPEAIVLKEVMAGMNGSVAIAEMSGAPGIEETVVVLYDDTEAITPRVSQRLKQHPMPLAVVPGCNPVDVRNALTKLLDAHREKAG